LTDLDKPGAYLRRTIVNLASYYRRNLANRRRTLAPLQTSVTPSEDAYPSDLKELQRLSPQERAVLHRSEVEGYSYAEIGELMGCSEAAARKRAMRGRGPRRMLQPGS
jgi:DNA-directed RNA polymerase specialized sigma24 family protein